MDAFPYTNTQDRPYHFSVGAIVLNRAREVLVLCRPTGVHLLPTETTEPGETLLQTLARGLAEEAGATASLVRYLGATEMPFSWDGHPYERPSSGTN